MKIGALKGLLLLALILAGYGSYCKARRALFPVSQPEVHPRPLSPALPGSKLTPFQKIIETDLARQVRADIRYRDGYYLGGEPPARYGVCTDVVIRSFRAAGVDLQQNVADDIQARRTDYAITKPDRNIDHRRCRNLVVFFQRHALALPIAGASADWQPGDIVFWDTPNNGKVDHVGMIGCGHDADSVPTVIHHWPGLPVSETEGLYGWTIRYHYRWRSQSKLG